jgi:iron(III) transport system permease protein
MLLWLVPLPLAIPTYLAAYVYVDLFEPLGLVHRTLALWFALQDAVRLLPNLRSLPGAIIVIALVLYPYVYLSARTMFQFQSAEFTEAAKTLGASRWTTFWRISCRWRVRAGGRGRAGIAGNVERYRRQRISRRPHAHGVGVHDLAQRAPSGAALVSCFALAIVAGLIAIERYDGGYHD